MTFRLVFTAGTGVTGAVIRLGTWSRAAHVGGWLEDGRILDATPSAGVSAHFGISGRVVSVLEVCCPSDVSRAAVDFAGGQLGKPYDWTAIAGFFARRDWRAPDSWFCMELWLAAFEAAEWPLLRLRHVNRGSPRDGMLSPRLAEIPISDGIRRALALR